MGGKDSRQQVLFILPVFFEFNRGRDFLTATTGYYFHWRGQLLESPLAPRRAVSLSRHFFILHPKTWSWQSQMKNLLNGWFRQNCGPLKWMYRDSAEVHGEGTLLMGLVWNNGQIHISSFQNQTFKLYFAIASRLSLCAVTAIKNTFLNPRITFTSVVLKNPVAWR